MTTFTATVPAPAPPDAVLEVLTDPDAARRWAPVAFRLREGEDRLVCGSRVHVVGDFAGRSVGFDVNVVEASTERLALISGYAAAYQPPRSPLAEPHIDTSRPGELVGIDCFFVGRLRGTKDPVWQVTAIDCHSSYAWADLITCPTGQPTAAHTSKLARRVAADLARAGWKLERILSDNGNEFRTSFDTTLNRLGAHHTRTRPGRPQTNGHVERLHKTILDECWRPSFARYLHIKYHGLRRDLADYITYYNTDRAHNGRITKGRIPADIIDPAHKIRPRT